MWWKNCKMKLLIATIILFVLGLLAILIASQTGAFDEDDEEDNNNNNNDNDNNNDNNAGNGG
jgi:nitrogen fixation-related uncharacterized protein